VRLLIIDNNIDHDSRGAPDLRREAAASGATVHVRRAPEGDLPADPAPFDRILVSGSKTSALADAPWITSLLEFIRRAIDQGKPFLGVCYGHQALVRALGGVESVRRGRESEIGWTRIERLGDGGPLFAGLPDTFYTFSSHVEEVARLPDGMKRLARSELCEIQACQLGDRPVFGIQFHPEKNGDDAEKTFAHWRREGTGPLLRAADTSKLYDPAVGATLFGNFFRA
jgi:GMP synthase (glutamine-hydrolysing)